MKNLLLRRMLLLNSQNRGSTAEKNLLTPSSLVITKEDTTKQLSQYVFFATEDIISGTVYKLTGTASFEVTNTSDSGYLNIYFRGFPPNYLGKQAIRKIVAPSLTISTSEEINIDYTADKDYKGGSALMQVIFEKDGIGTITFTNMKLVKI